MDGYYYEDREALERCIRAMMAGEALPPGVVGYDVEFGAYRDGGDPAVWLHIHVPSDLPFDKQMAREYSTLTLHLHQKLADIVPSRLALVEITAPPGDILVTHPLAGT